MIKIINYVVTEKECIPVQDLDEEELQRLGEELQKIMMAEAGFCPIETGKKSFVHNGSEKEEMVRKMQRDQPEKHL